MQFLWDSTANVDFPKRDVISLKCYLRVQTKSLEFYQCWLWLFCVAFVSKLRIPARGVVPSSECSGSTAPAAGLQSSPWRGNYYLWVELNASGSFVILKWQAHRKCNGWYGQSHEPDLGSQRNLWGMYTARQNVKITPENWNFSQTK